MKKPLTKAAVVFPLLAALSACIPSPEELETTPVKVNTPEGIVTCQLYRRDRVNWDRAIDFPASKMSVPQADAYCREEGRRQLQ